MTAPQNILVVKNRAMGDSIIGLAAVQYLRELFPNARIIYALPCWMVPLYDKVEIAADEVMGLSLTSIGDWLRLWKTLKNKRVDLIYELFQSGRTSKFFSLYSFLMGVQYNFHNHHKNNGGKVHDQGVIKPVIQRDLDGIFSNLTDRKHYPNYLKYPPVMKVNILAKKRKIIFGVVATRETKMWPLEYFLELAHSIDKYLPDVCIKVPISNSSLDLVLEEKLKSLGMPANMEIVKLPLRELANFMGESILYVGNDTGLKHLAVATGVKTITFFGPEPPLEWHPYDKDIHHFFYIDQLECRTAVAHYCGLFRCDSMICLKNLIPKDVLKLITRECSED